MLSRQAGHRVLVPRLHTQPRPAQPLPELFDLVDPGNGLQKLSAQLGPLLLSVVICSSPNRSWGGTSPLLLLLVLPLPHDSSHRCTAPQPCLAHTALYINVALNIPLTEHY